MSLLDKAKKYRPNRESKVPIDKEVIELALGWLRGEVTCGQVAFALYDTKKDGGQIQGLMARALVIAYKNNRITIKD